jgi:adenylate kinase family enzyme
MKRISIVGISGSGKSTLANSLGKKLNLPVFHLDKYYWTLGWKVRYEVKADFNDMAKKLTEGDSWVIDGNYRGSMDVRFDRADTLVYLDFPKWKCIFRVIKRALNRKQPFDKEGGLKDRTDWSLIKWIFNYPKHETLERVLRYKDTKNVYILKNDKDVANFLNSR